MLIYFLYSFNNLFTSLTVIAFSYRNDFLVSLMLYLICYVTTRPCSEQMVRFKIKL